MADLIQISITEPISSNISDGFKVNINIAKNGITLHTSDGKLPWSKSGVWEIVESSLNAYEQYKYKETWPNILLNSNPKIFKHFFKSNNQPKRSRISEHGREFYDFFFNDKSKTEIEKQFPDRKTDQQFKIVEFNFQSPDSLLLSYPWEVLHSKNYFLFKSANTMVVRTIKYDSPINEDVFPLTEINLILLASKTHTTRQGSLKSFDSEHISTEIASSKFEVKLQKIAYSVEDFLGAIINFKEVNYLHIDAHGGFGTPCDNPDCDHLISPIEMDEIPFHCPECNSIYENKLEPKGYLLFTNSGKAKWYSGETISTWIKNTKIRIIFLSACNSAISGSRNAYSSVAGALIRNGIPIVMAFNYLILEETASKFSSNFYSKLLNNHSLFESFANARISLTDSDEEWYRPVIFMIKNNYLPQGTIIDLQSRTNDQKNSFERLIIPNNRTDLPVNLFQFINNEIIKEMEEHFLEHCDDFLELFGIKPTKEPIATHTICQIQRKRLLGLEGKVISLISDLDSMSITDTQILKGIQNLNSLTERYLKESDYAIFLNVKSFPEKGELSGCIRNSHYFNSKLFKEYRRQLHSSSANKTLLVDSLEQKLGYLQRAIHILYNLEKMAYDEFYRVCAS